MPFLIFDGAEHALAAGDTPLGGTEGSPIGAPGPAAAIVQLDPGGAGTVRRADGSATVLVNGDPIGADPVPLRHGSRISVNGRQVVYGDARQVGKTAHIAGVKVDDLALLAALPSEPTVDSGGRLVEIANGRSHDIPEGGIVIGRDPMCDIVTESSETSRRHASIKPGLFGYVLADTSANGVLVNGARVDESRVLGMGDTIRIGPHEFRFEAEAASYEPDVALRPVKQGASPASGAGGAGGAAGVTAGNTGAENTKTGSSTAGSAIASASPVRSVESAGAPLLASLEVLTEGSLKGTRYRIERPLAHVGRSDQNDVILPESSISGSHAVLQRRANGWFLVDASSRNGSYVDGRRVQGESPLSGPCELRFGNLRLLFRPIAAANTGEDESGTKNVIGAAE
jgi:pSer/pThr/pTyr-binding forkhead associated (FHA) protein